MGVLCLQTGRTKRLDFGSPDGDRTEPLVRPDT